MTLVGAGASVLSSTLLYMNFALFFLSQSGDPFWANPLLHPLVFGANADSVVNDLGLILVCGVLKTLSLKKLVSTVQPAPAEEAPPGNRNDGAPHSAVTRTEQTSEKESSSNYSSAEGERERDEGQFEQGKALLSAMTGTEQTSEMEASSYCSGAEDEGEKIEEGRDAAGSSSS